MDRSDVVVVGGGLAGLAAANYVARAGFEVTLYEARQRLGGRARTDERQQFHLNRGPHALYRGGKGFKVLAELGIPPVGGRPPLGGHILFGNTLFEAPGQIGSLLRTRSLGYRAKLELGRVFALLPRVDPGSIAHLSAQQWIEQLVTQSRARDLLQTVGRLTTYCGQLDHLSADVAVRQMQLGLGGGVLYLDRGWGSVVHRLEQNLLATGRATIRTGERIRELPDARFVIVALNSAEAAGGLLGQSFEVGPPALVACLDLGLSSPPPVGFVLGGDDPLYLSDHSLAAQLAPPGHSLVSLVAYLGGKATGKFESPEHFDRRILDEFAATCGIDAETIVVNRYLRRMVASSSIPTVETGGTKGRPSATAIPRSRTGGAVFLAGDWVGSEGFLADASLASARQAAVAALESLTRATRSVAPGGSRRARASEGTAEVRRLG